MSYVESKMAKLLGTDLWLDGQGTNSTAIAVDGMQAAIDDGVLYPSYGGITRSDIATGDNVGINSYVLNVAGKLSLSQVETAFGSCWFGSEHPDLLAMTQPIWDVLWNKIQPQQRFEEKDTDVAKIGFRAMRFNGSSAVVDQYLGSGYLYMFNTKYIQFWITTYPKYQSTKNGLPRMATYDGKPSLIDSDAAMQTRRNASNGDRDRLSERASLVDDAIVGPCGKSNRKSTAEMTVPVVRRVTKVSDLRVGRNLRTRTMFRASTYSPGTC